MSIDYITIPAEVLQCPDINDKQKMLLGLIIAFGNKGLMMGNDELGKLLMLTPDYVSQIINAPEMEKYVRITGAQSKYRKIYFEKNLKVKDVLLLEKPQSKTVLLLGKTRHTLRKNTTYFEKNLKHNIKNINKRSARTLKNKTFVKPTLGQITDYAKSIGYELDGQYFCDWYEGKGWLVGKSPMRDWQATVRTWKLRDDKRKGGTGGGIIQTQDCDPAEAERLRIAKKAAGF